MQKFYHYLKQSSDKWWFAPALGLLAFVDFWILVVPTDGLLISSAMLHPRRWLSLALFMSVGSVLGGMSIAYVAQVWGGDVTSHFFPDYSQTEFWLSLSHFFHEWGLWLVFAIAASPLVQQPVILLAAMTPTPWWHIGLIYLLGRVLKFLIFAYLASHAPRLITRIWGVKGEVKQVLDS